MPVYSLTSPKTGRTYDVDIDHGADNPPPPNVFQEIGQQLDARVQQAEKDRPFFQVGDTLNAVGDALGGLPTTLTSSAYRLWEGTKRPDQYSPSARAAFEAERKYAEDLQREEQNRLLMGESSSAGSAMREAAPSLGFSGVTMGATAAGNILGKPLGALIGGVGGAPSGPGAVGTAGIGATVGGTVGGMALSGGAAYRMAANQFMDEAFNRIAKERQAAGLPWGEAEKQDTYQKLLPLAQDQGLWEAGPEAIGNAVGMGVGKYVFGFGKKAATEIADTIGKTVLKKGTATVGGLATELGTETVTQIGQGASMAQADALARNDPNWQQAQSPYAGEGGVKKAFTDVAPATLAQSALMLGLGGGLKLGSKLLPSKTQQTAPQAGGVGQAVSAPLAQQDTGELTAEDVAEFEVAGSKSQVSSFPIAPETPAQTPRPQTITGSNVQTGTEMPVPPPTADVSFSREEMVDWFKALYGPETEVYGSSGGYTVKPQGQRDFITNGMTPLKDLVKQFGVGRLDLLEPQAAESYLDKHVKAAVKLPDGSFAIGKKGENHAMIAKRLGLDLPASASAFSYGGVNVTVDEMQSHFNRNPGVSMVEQFTAPAGAGAGGMGVGNETLISNNDPSEYTASGVEIPFPRLQEKYIAENGRISVAEVQRLASLKRSGVSDQRAIAQTIAEGKANAAGLDAAGKIEGSLAEKEAAFNAAYGEVLEKELLMRAAAAEQAESTLQSPAANRLGRGLADLMPGKVASSKSQVSSSGQPETLNLKPETLVSAYQAASAGQSTAFVDLNTVYEQAAKAQPGLTREAFAQQVREAYDNGSVMLEGANTTQEAASAGLAIDGTPVGTAVRMAIPDVSSSKSQVSSSGQPETLNLKPEAMASPAKIAATQADNEAKLTRLGLPTKAGTRIWGKGPLATALTRISADYTQPKTLRMMARLLSKMDLGNVILSIEADGRAGFAGEYRPRGKGRGEIALNTRVLGRGSRTGQGDVIDSIVHEVLHHVTYRRLENPKTQVEKEAKAALEKLRKRALAALSLQEQGSRFDYELSNEHEFISALFTRADFQTALANIPHDQAPTLGERVRSVLDEIFRQLAQLVSRRPVPVGSVLEASMANALRLIETGDAEGGARKGEAMKSPGGWSMVDTENESAGSSAEDMLQFQPDETLRIPGSRIDEALSDLEAKWQQERGADAPHRMVSVGKVWERGDAARGGREALGFIDAFQNLTGKQVVWIDTRPQDGIPFKAAVMKSRSNLIFVHARAEGNLLALVGHEWGHTLSGQDKPLYREMQKELARYITRKKGKELRGALKGRYRLGIRSEEITNNIIGDFFTDPAFWREVEERNKPLVERLVASVMRWFKQLTQSLTRSQWGTGEALTDLNKARNAVANAFATALRKGPYSDLAASTDDAELLKADQPADKNASAPMQSPAADEYQRETQARWASPNEADRMGTGIPMARMEADARAWLDGTDTQTAIELIINNGSGLPPYIQNLAAGMLQQRLSEQWTSGKSTEVQKTWAKVQMQRLAKAWTNEHLSAEAGRTLGVRRVVGDKYFKPLESVLAALEVLYDRGKRVIDPKFDGGTEGAVTKVITIIVGAGREAGLSLAKLLDEARRAEFPGLRWAEIFGSLPETQKARQKEIYKRLLAHPKFAGLSTEQRLKLVNELEKQWQRERQKVINREMERLGLGPNTKPADVAKVKNVTPRLLRLMNLGLLNSDTFREALAQEYGIKTLDAQQAAELRKLGEDIQRAPEGLPRRKLEQRMVERLQALTESTLVEILESWWTASVLSGWRTQADIFLSVANGLEDVTFGSLVTALRTGNPRVAGEAILRMIGNLPTAMGEALDHVLTGNRSMMRNYDAETRAILEDGGKMSGDVGAELWRKGGWRKIPGGFMIAVARMMTALDHINSTSTYEGAKAMALARHPELYRKALLVSAQDKQAARLQARQELTGGALPKTFQEKREEIARMKEILEAGIPTEIIAQAQEIGREAALQGEPTGLGWALMEAARGLSHAVKRMEQTYAAKPGADKMVMHALRVASTLSKILTGTKFVRTVGHATNRGLSYLPGVGLVRLKEGGMTGAKADILIAKQLMGTAFVVGLLMYLRGGDDDDDKATIEGGWSDLTPQERSQLMADDKQPYSITWRNDQGKRVSVNYQQWGIGTLLAMAGAMEDVRKYKGGDGMDDLNLLIHGIGTGAMGVLDKAQLSGLQTIFGRNQRSGEGVAGFMQNLNKYGALTVGGMVPRIAKDVDAVISPELRDSSEWWMKWAAQVPMVREMSSGKRVNILGDDITLDRSPTSRIVQFGTMDPAYRILGRLNERDIWLPDPSSGVRVLRLADGTRRPMNAAEKDRYQRAVGASYKAYLLEHGAALLQMDPEQARKTISRVTEHLRNAAARGVVR